VNFHVQGSRADERAKLLHLDSTFCDTEKRREIGCIASAES